jgi:hypothetical protein
LIVVWDTNEDDLGTRIILREDDDLTIEQKGSIRFLENRRQMHQLYQKPTTYHSYHVEEGSRTKYRSPCKFINNRWYNIYWSNSGYWTDPTMKFTKYDYILNELALPPSIQTSEASEDESEDGDGATSPQQDSAGANSSSDDSQNREPVMECRTRWTICFPNPLTHTDDVPSTLFLLC